MKPSQRLDSIISGNDLSAREAEALLGEMAGGRLDPAQIAAVLTALRAKGEAPEEIAGFVRGMRRRMRTLRVSGTVVDTCGTGGDHSGTFNISTTVALVLAGAGVRVAKHGNRSASSQCGSADVLEALGVGIDLSPRTAERVLKQAGIVFLFAPHYHPAMKNVAPVRKALGIRTIFNLLGPFTNPAMVRRQLIGVPTPADAKRLAQVATMLGYRHALIVSSRDGLDELSIAAPTDVYEVRGKAVRHVIVAPERYGLRRSSVRALRGGTARQNARVIQEILAGQPGAKRDIVLLNAGAALVAAGKTRTIRQGVRLAADSIDSGNAGRSLGALVAASAQGKA